MLSKCPRQFWYRYILGWKIPPGAAAQFGSAYHKTMEANFKYKVDSGEDLSLEEVKDIFSDEWKVYSEDVEWFYEEENKDHLTDRGIELVGSYVKKVAPSRMPTQVEYEFEIPLPEIDAPFVGVIDLILDNDKLLDHKTSSRRWYRDRANNELQPTAYYISFSEIFGEQPKEFIYDIAPKTGKPEIQTVTTTRSQQDIEVYLDRIKTAQTLVSKEVYPRTDPSSWWCSEKWCGYYGNCMKGILLHRLRLREIESDDRLET